MTLFNILITYATEPRVKCITYVIVLYEYINYCGNKLNLEV